ncbi:MAG: SDR family oxidoreductase [Ilumatobacteraceae bacterium]
MDLGLHGKRALVTGSTRGIGRAIAETLLSEGASVSICARTEADIESAIAEMSALGTVIGGVIDARDSDALRAWINSSQASLGGIDIYIHNTSGKSSRTIDGWVHNFETDLLSLVHAVDEARDALVDGGGSLISIGTTASAEHFASGANNYSALKAAVTNWTLGQAQILGAQGVRCNVVSPGPIFVEGGDWDRIRERMPDFFAASEKNHPGGALGTPADVADAVAFLASERARHINGTNITVDGGFLKRIDY